MAISRRWGLCCLAVWAAFAETPVKFVTLDVVAVGPHGQPVPGLQSNEIRILDNKHEQTAAYWRSDQLRPAACAMAVVLNLSYAGIKTARWSEATHAMRPLEASCYLFFYVQRGNGTLVPVHELPKPDAEPAAPNVPWMKQTLPPFETTWSLHTPDAGSGMISFFPYMDLAARLAAFPGRKSLVCIGCLLESAKEFEASRGAAETARATELRHLADAFREARVAVYAVGGKPANTLVEDNAGPVQIGDASGVVEATGGRIYGMGQIGQAIAEAAVDQRSSYRLAYLPGAENWDGKRHKVVLESTRKDVHLVAMKWYAADRLEDLAREWRPAIPDVAVVTPFEPRDIAVSVSAPEKAADSVRVHVRVEAGDVLLLPRGGRYAGSLTMEVFCYTAEGRRMACTEPMRVALDLSEQERREAMSGGLRFPLELKAQEFSAKFRVVVHDEYSGANGSVTYTAGEVR